MRFVAILRRPIHKAHDRPVQSQNWDIAFVIVNDSANMFSGMEHPGSELAIGLIYDLNRDHFYQREEVGNVDQYFDQFLALWMASPDRDMQEFIRNMAYDDSWASYCDSIGKAEYWIKFVEGIRL